MRLLLLLCVSLTVSVASSQNLLKNGDFEARALSPWRTAGYGLNPGVVSFNTDGTGVSRSYAVNPGGRANNQNVPHVIGQTVNIAPVPYEVTLDVAVVARPTAINPSVPVVRVLLGTQILMTQNFSPARFNERSTFPKTVPTHVTSVTSAWVRSARVRSA